MYDYISGKTLIQSHSLFITWKNLHFNVSYINTLLCCPFIFFFTFRVQCCDVRYDFRTQRMFGSVSPAVVYMRARLIYVFCACLRIVVSYAYCVVFLLCLSLSCVLCTLFFQFLWIVHYWLPIRFSLTLIYKLTRVNTEMCCPKCKCGCQYFILLTLKKKNHGHKGPWFF